MQINPQTTALVLIDLQKGVMAMPVAPYSASTVYERSMKLAKRFREAGGLVVHVRVSFASNFADAFRPPVDKPNNFGALPQGWDELPEPLPPADLLITKKQWGAFYGTEMDLQLRRRGIKTIVLGGIATNIGVESTARAASEHGYELVVPEDMCSCLNNETHEFSFKYIMPRLARVVKSESITLG